ncbi:MAG: T9SS type A sorting domain-containing protein [Bacteroidia bacterium]
MKKILFLCFIVLNIYNSTYAQITFRTTYQGIGAEKGYSVEVCADGYLIVGSTNSFGAGQNDVLVIKTDLNGTPVWKKNYGGFNNDLGLKVKKINDGNFIIAGITNSFTTDSMNFYILKIDSTGGLLWSGIFGGPNQDSATSFIQTYDNGLLVVGSTTSIGAGNRDVYLLKLDAAGNYLWAKAIGNSGNDIATAVLEMSDHGFLITGYTDGFGFGGNTPFLLRTDSVGIVQWVKTYHLPTWSSPKDSRAYDIIEGFSNDYIFVGQECCGFIGDGRHFVIDVDSLGNPYWMKDYQFNSGASSARSVIKTLDGKFLVGGIYSWGQTQLLKINTLGAVVWDYYYNAGEGYEVKSTPDNQCVFTGYEAAAGDYKMFLIKPRADGTLNCQSNPTFTAMLSNITPAIASQTFTSTMTNFNLIDSCIVSTSGISFTTLCINTNIENIQTDKSFSIYPNPANDLITLKSNVEGTLVITDITGRKLLDGAVQIPLTNVSLESLEPGIYSVTIYSGGHSFKSFRVIKSPH